MDMTKVGFELLLVAAVLGSVRGSCYNVRMEKNMANEDMLWCVDPASQEHIPMNGTKVTSKCYECECSSQEMTCCGVGLNAGPISPPAGHKIVEDPGCDFHFEPL